MYIYVCMYVYISYFPFLNIYINITHMQAK